MYMTPENWEEKLDSKLNSPVGLFNWWASRTDFDK